MKSKALAVHDALLLELKDQLDETTVLLEATQRELCETQDKLIAMRMALDAALDALIPFAKLMPHQACPSASVPHVQDVQRAQVLTRDRVREVRTTVAGQS
jgi:hypothetical protein